MNGNIEIYTLFSGSSGNSVLFSCGNTNILFDAGRNAKAVTASLTEVGRSFSDISAVFITHEHSDHISALEVLSKKHRIPIHMTEKAAENVSGKDNMLACVIPHETEFSVTVGDISVNSFRTYHDSADPVGYTVSFSSDGEKKRFGLMTDTGHYTSDTVNILSECEYLILEANHDRDMVRKSSYPYHIKQRILSDCGHLSNEQCGELCAEIFTCNRRKENGKLLLAHLSENNNTPDMAYDAVISKLKEAGSAVIPKIANRYSVTKLL